MTRHVKTAMELAESLSVKTAFPILLSVAATVFLGSGWPLALCGAISLFSTLLLLARVDRPRSYLPTFVTCFRAAIACGLFAFGVRENGAAIALGVLTVFTLDGLDGYLARRLRSASVLGARLDMETDSFLVMGVCTLLHLRGLGLWVLTSGLLRYGYVLFVYTFGARGEAPRSNFARYAFGTSLTGLTLGFLISGPYASYGPVCATAVLLYSFGRSFYWSLRVDGVRVSQSNSTSAPNEK